MEIIDVRLPLVPSIYVELTEKCNYKCRYCYNQSDVSKNRFISFQDYCSFLDNAKMHGLKQITLSGGEPTLHPQFYDVLYENHKAGIKQTIITNGSTLDARLCDALKRMDINCNLTLDGGDCQTHNFYRGAGAYECLSDNLRLLREKNLLSQTNVRCNLTMKNHNQMIAMAEYLERYGVRQFSFALIRAQGRGVDVDTISLPEMPNVQKKLKSSIRYIKDRINPNCSEHFAELSNACPLSEMASSFNPRVDYLGDIYPCQILSDKSFRLGNIANFQLALVNAIDMESMFKHRANIGSHCARCAYYAMCKGGCVADNLPCDASDAYRKMLCAMRKKSVWTQINHKRGAIQ